jgi:3-methylcrotonyl-CoA carboxylase alpha subunit
MIAKVVAWAPDRERALGLLNRTLADYQIVGPVTNIDFLQRAIAHRDFAKGQVTTGFIAQHLNELVPPEEHASLASVYTAALSVLLGEAGSAPAAASTAGAWDAHHMFRVNGEAARLLRFKRGDATLVVEVHHTAEPGAFRMRLVPDPRQPHHAAGKKGVGASSAHSAPLPVSGGNPSELVTVRGRLDDHRLFASVGGRTFEATVAQVGNNVHVFVEGQHTELAVHEERFAAGAAEHGSVSPMAGRIVKVAVKAGDTVKKGAQLIIMEAMKMEHVIRAARDGVVAKIVCGEGDVVEGGKTLVLFQADEAATSA